MKVSLQSSSKPHLSLFALLLMSIYRVGDEVLALDVVVGDELSDLSRVGLNLSVGVAAFISKTSIFCYLHRFNVIQIWHEPQSDCCPLTCSGVLAFSFSLIFGVLLTIQDFAYSGAVSDLNRYNNTLTDGVSEVIQNDGFKIILALSWGGLNGFLCYRIVVQWLRFCRYRFSVGEDRAAMTSLQRQFLHFQVFLDEAVGNDGSKKWGDDVLLTMCNVDDSDQRYNTMAGVIRSHPEQLVDFLFGLQSVYSYYEHRFSRHTKYYWVHGYHDGNRLPSLLRPVSADERCARVVVNTVVLSLSFSITCYYLFTIEVLFPSEPINMTISNQSGLFYINGTLDLTISHGQSVPPAVIAAGIPCWFVGGMMVVSLLIPIATLVLDTHFLRTPGFLRRKCNVNVMLLSFLLSGVSLISLFHRHFYRDQDELYYLPMLSQFIMAFAALYQLLSPVLITQNTEGKLLLFDAVKSVVGSTPKAVLLDKVKHNLGLERLSFYKAEQQRVLALKKDRERFRGWSFNADEENAGSLLYGTKNNGSTL